MDNIITSVQVVLAIAGAIGIIGGATAVLSRWMSPYRLLKKKVDRHDELLHIDKGRLDKGDASDRAYGFAILAIMDTLITGNNVENLKKARKDLEAHLIKN